MEVKEWLQGLYRVEKRINAKLDQIEKYRRMAMRITSSTDGEHIAASGNHSRVEDAVISICGIEDDVREEIDELRQYRRDAMAVIRRVSEAKYRDVLEWRCVTGWSFQRIAEEYGHDEHWAKVTYGKALNDAREIAMGIDELVEKYSLRSLANTHLT